MANTTNTQANAAFAAESSCVLVAEDEELVRDLAVRVLSAHGFRVLAARNGGEAIDVFREHAGEIDAVLLDLTMPVLSGSEVLAEMQRLCPSVRVVLTSGYADSSDMRSAEDGSHVSFLQKPYRSEGLVSRIRAVLA